jgi:hypothetical protein
VQTSLSFWRATNCSAERLANLLVSSPVQCQLSDNAKTAVIKACFYDPQTNRSFA